jgi:ATP-binding cassette subfamily C protein
MFNTLRKCLLFLPPAQRWRWGGMVPLVVSAAALEALGAAAVFLLIKLIGDPLHPPSFPFAGLIYRILPVGDPRAIVLWATVLVALFYVVKNAFLALVVAIESRVVTDSVTQLASDMLRGYLSLPLAFHFQRNSAELIRHTADGTDVVFRQVMAAAVAIVTEMLITLAIVSVLMTTAPVSTLIAIVMLFSLLAGLLRLTRRVLTRWSRREHDLKRETLQTLQQTFGALKEVKLRGGDAFFHGLYSAQHRTLSRLRHRYITLNDSLRLLIETVFVCGMLLLITLVNSRSVAGPDIVPLLGLYAYAGFRVIPSVNRVLMHLNTIRWGSVAVEKLYDDFVTFRRVVAATASSDGVADLSFTDRIELAGVSYTYAGAPTPAAQAIDLVIRRGESIGIVGPTGAGKSTLVDMILGFLQPATGHVIVDGCDIFARDAHLRGWQQRIGYVPQATYLIDDTLRRNIAFALPERGIDDAKLSAAVRLAQLEEFVAGLPHGLETVVGERGVRLSGGERQRVAIARALYHQPELLVFDEATSALDLQTERELTRAIDELHGKKTLIIIAHRLSTVHNCDRLVFLRNGRIAGIGSFDELLAGNAEFQNMVRTGSEAVAP